MDRKPFFSIIIPVYNVAPYLRECLDSVLAQTFGEWECICVDDGSTDGSGAILDEYAAMDARFRVIHQANTGTATTRNKGLASAHGEWMWFVDSDDAVHPQALDFLSRLIKVSKGAKTISFTTQREGEQVLGQWEELPEVSQCVTQDYIDTKSLRMHRRGACMTVVRGDVAKQFVFKKYTIGEDVLYHMSILWDHPETCLLSAPIYFYRIRSGSAVHGVASKEKVFDLLATEYEMLQLYANNAHHCQVRDVDEFYRWNESFVWYTFNGMFFKLPMREQQELLPQWIRLQRLHQEVRRPQGYKRWALWAIRALPVAWWCKLLVRGPVWVLGVVDWVWNHGIHGK